MRKNVDHEWSVRTGIPILMKQTLSGSYVTSETGCWLWMRTLSKKGYGRVPCLVDGVRRQVGAHRVFYTALVGEIPDGMLVRHTCDTPRCVNPAHLVLGTHTQNMADMTERDRAARGASNANSKLSDQQVAEIRRRAGEGETFVSISRDFCVSTSQIGRVCSGKHWRP